jgi:hypothetical protein
MEAHMRERRCRCPQHSGCTAVRHAHLPPSRQFNNAAPVLRSQTGECAASDGGGVMAGCDGMDGRGWCHKCVSLGCHGPAQTPHKRAHNEDECLGRSPLLHPAVWRAASSHPWMSWRR